MTRPVGTAHELNNVLAKILGAAELALDYPLPDGARRELQAIITSVDQGVGLVSGLRESTRQGASH